MPAIQSKVRSDGKPGPQNVNQKTKNPSKPRNKDRTAVCKNGSTMERSVKQKKKVFVPELDLNSLNSRTQQNNNAVEDNLRKADILTPPLASATKSRRSVKTFTDDVASVDYCIGEVKTSGSVFCLSPYSSLVDVEILNPDHPPDDYFDCNEVDEIYRSLYPDLENSYKCTEYGTPKIDEDCPMPPGKSATSYKAANSPGVLRHFNALLHQEETSRTNLLQKSEIALLRDIVKADERHRRLQRDDYALLREILINQLKEVCQQERVIQMALKKIQTRGDEEVEVTTLQVDSAEQPMEEQRMAMGCNKTPHQKVDIVFENSGLASPRSAKGWQRSPPRTPRGEYESTIKNDASANKTPRQEVDDTFKNVPSLQTEIRILRTLGMKLEEALNKSTAEAVVPPLKRAIILHEVQKRCIAQTSHCACSTVRSKGIRVLLDQAQEFQIRHQTIEELKLEREFYIPTDTGGFALQRTNLHQLSRNPELLLRRLRPIAEDSTTKFNFIEQNPMFFNHLLRKLCNIYAESTECHPTFIPKPVHAHRLEDLLSIKDSSGDHRLEIRQDQPKTPSNSSLGKRKKKRHCTTPSQRHEVVTAKNRLVRNILLATFPVSMLFTVAAAIWYPDLICP